MVAPDGLDRRRHHVLVMDAAERGRSGRGHVRCQQRSCGAERQPAESTD
jgi:hypothetical protein